METQQRIVSTKSSPQKSYEYEYPRDANSPACFSVKFDDLPCLVPLPLKTDIGGVLESIRGASAPRIFNLERDWLIQIDTHQNDDYDEDLSGTIIIPKYYPQHSNKKPQFDGASVPLPWLISFLSFGILRPISVMLTASLVHDFAFEYGELLYRDENGKVFPRSVQRHDADQLFYDIIKTVNKMPRVARIAWVAVRLGWFWVKYNGEARQGRFPKYAFSVLFLILTVLLGSVTALVIIYGIVTATHMLSMLFAVILPIYTLIFLSLKLTTPKQSS